MAAAWLLAAAFVLGSAALLAMQNRRWWTAMAVVSYFVIVTSWSDAKAATVVNIVMLLAAGSGYTADGSGPFGAQHRALSRAALANRPAQAGVVSEDDLARLPVPVGSSPATMREFPSRLHRTS